MPGERGGVRELGEGVLHEPGVERAQHRVARGVVGYGRAHRELEVRAGLAELDVRAVPQLEPGPLHDAHRRGRSGHGHLVCVCVCICNRRRIRVCIGSGVRVGVGRRMGVDERELPRHERVRLGKGEDARRRRVRPPFHRPRRYRP